eukprot:m.109477 g.109477  ORF g.109477 m.109477 type:complete len:117 (+) comp9303_c0_seq2:1725-2075(+)
MRHKQTAVPATMADKNIAYARLLRAMERLTDQALDDLLISSGADPRDCASKRDKVHLLQQNGVVSKTSVQRFVDLADESDVPMDEAVEAAVKYMSFLLPPPPGAAVAAPGQDAHLA